MLSSSCSLYALHPRLRVCVTMVQKFLQRRAILFKLITKLQYTPNQGNAETDEDDA